MKNKKIAMFINDLKTNMYPRTCFKGMKNNICKILKQVQNDKVLSENGLFSVRPYAYD